MYCYFADGGATLLEPAAKQKNVDLYSILFDSAELFGHFGLLIIPKEEFYSSFVWRCAQKEGNGEFLRHFGKICGKQKKMKL